MGAGGRGGIGGQAGSPPNDRGRSYPTTPGLEGPGFLVPESSEPGQGASARWAGGRPRRLRTEQTEGRGGVGTAPSNLPARGLHPARGSWSRRARWEAGTCRWEAPHGEMRRSRDRALPGTSASWEPKERSWRVRETKAQNP